MVIDASQRFAERTAELMFTLPREEIEKRFANFHPSHVSLILAVAKRMALERGWRR